MSAARLAFAAPAGSVARAPSVLSSRSRTHHEFAGALRRSASFPDACRSAGDAARTNGRAAIVLLEKAASSTEGFAPGLPYTSLAGPLRSPLRSRGSSLRSFPSAGTGAEAASFPRTASPSPVPITRIRWRDPRRLRDVGAVAREFRPEHAAEIEALQDGVRIVIRCARSTRSSAWCCSALLQDVKALRRRRRSC